MTVTVPGGNVVPPGPYMLFVNQKTARGDIPSVAKQLFVGAQSAPTPAAPASKGTTAADYQGIQTNDPGGQLSALLSFLGGNRGGTGGAVPANPAGTNPSRTPAAPASPTDSTPRSAPPAPDRPTSTPSPKPSATEPSSGLGGLGPLLGGL